MNKSDKRISERLTREFDNAARNADIPQKLQKENIVEMLKNGDSINRDFSVKTGTEKIISFRRVASIAAVFVIVVALAAVFGIKKPFIFSTNKSAKSGFEMKTPVIGLNSSEEIEKAVRHIIDDGKNGSVSSENGKNKSGEYVASPNKNAPEYEHGVIDVESGKAAVEADILKNDGKYLYIVTSGKNAETGKTVEQIKIVCAVPASEMHTVSTIILSDDAKTEYRDECFEMYLKGHSLIVLMKRYYGDSETETSTAAVFYDISDPASPVKTREHIQDGSYVSSKIYGGKLCLITNKRFSESETEIPVFSVDGIINRLDAENIFMAVNDPEASCLFITLTDISDRNIPVGRLAVLGSGSNIYCAAGSVYVSRNFVSVEADEQGERKSLTEIYKFSADASGVKMCGSYVVEGNVPSSAFMDEYDGYLRVASLGSNSGNIYILNSKTELVGKLENAFNISFIPNIKFIGTKAYVINGSGSGVLTVIDLSDISAPKSSISESADGFGLDLFKVSGSEYIDIKSDISDGKFTITLYKIADSGEPKAVSSFTLDSVVSVPGYGDSRCFALIQDKNIFGIPVIKADAESGTVESDYILFNVSDGVISSAGSFIHNKNYVSDAAVRAAGIEDTLYTVSGEKVVAFSMSDLSVISSAEIK